MKSPVFAALLKREHILHSNIKAMDMSSTWLSQQEMQDQGFMNRYQMNKPYHTVTDFSTADTFSSFGVTKNPSFVDQIPACIKEIANIKMLPSSYKAANNIISNRADENLKSKPKPLPDIPNTFTISFGDIKPKDEIIPFIDSFSYMTSGTKKGSMIRNRIQLQDHMLAERKRREKLARRFISLSALLPGLKKMDKATVLEDATDYIQELQCRVMELEGLSYMKTNNMQPAISSKKQKLSFGDNNCTSSDEPDIGESPSPCNPDISVKMLGSSVLLRIYCWKNYLSLVKAFSEIQKLGLSITSSSALPFANTLLITIVSKKKVDLLMTSTDLVKNLKQAMRTLGAIEFQVQDCHMKIVH